MTGMHRTLRQALTATLAAAMMLAFVPGAAHAIPAWARKYNMNCTGCHYPVPPVLNADGLAFKWAGYRMPDQIGTNVEVTKIGDYFAARGIVQYAYEKSSDAAADVNQFSVPEVNLFAAGPFGKWFGAFVEVAVDDAGAGTAVQMYGDWGKEDGFWSLHIDQGHLLAEGAVAGLDRSIGANAPLPIDIGIGSGIEFGFGDHTGMDFSRVFNKKDRLAIGVANSMPAGGGSARPRQDFFISNQYIWDAKGGGLNLLGYVGNASGVDPDFVDATSHFYRVIATASHYFGTFQANGGYVYGEDTDLPVGNLFTTTSVTGQSYWLGAGYTFAESYLTFYGRWEYVDPNKDVSNDALTRYVIGGVAPLMTPQYLKVNLEYFHDAPQLSGAPTRQGVAIVLTASY
jgi:hypothetical protein